MHELVEYASDGKLPLYIEMETKFKQQIESQELRKRKMILQ